MNQHDQFCDECGVSRDLHDGTESPEDGDCNRARQKADLIARFASIGPQA